MATANINCSYNRYNRGDGALWTPENGTDIYAGKNADGSNSYKIFLGFPAGAYSGVSANSALLSMTRFNRDSSGQKTLLVRVVDSVNEGTGSYSAVDSTVVSWVVAAGAGVRSVNIAPLFTALAASSSRRLLIYSTGNGEYTEFRAISASTISIALDYTSGPSGPSGVQVKVSSAWKAIIAFIVKVLGAWKPGVAMWVKVGGTWKKIF